EERWAFHVCRVFVPLEQLACRSIKGVPALVAAQRFFIRLPEHLGPDRGLNCALNFGLRWPHITQENRLAVWILTERFRIQIDVDMSGKGVRYDERRRCEIIRTNLRVDASFEVAVTAENRCNHQSSIFHRFRYGIRQGTTVADACGA